MSISGLTNIEYRKPSYGGSSIRVYDCIIDNNLKLNGSIIGFTGMANYSSTDANGKIDIYGLTKYYEDAAHSSLVVNEDDPDYIFNFNSGTNNGSSIIRTPKQSASHPLFIYPGNNKNAEFLAGPNSGSGNLLEINSGATGLYMGSFPKNDTYCSVNVRQNSILIKGLPAADSNSVNVITSKSDGELTKTPITNIDFYKQRCTIAASTSNSAKIATNTDADSFPFSNTVGFGDNVIASSQQVYNIYNDEGLYDVSNKYFIPAHGGLYYFNASITYKGATPGTTLELNLATVKGTTSNAYIMILSNYTIESANGVAILSGLILAQANIPLYLNCKASADVSIDERCIVSMFKV